MPRINAIDSTGIVFDAASVAANTAIAAPDTPAAPFDVSRSTASSTSCSCQFIGVLVACARNTAAAAKYRHVPSWLKEYAVGNTRPTTDLSQPSCSSLSINCGKTVSEELVPITSSNSAPM